MHMADALLSPSVGATFWAATLGAIGYASKKLKEHIDEKMIPLMGVMGAFIFAGQMINFTIPGTGSSGHLGGGMLLAAVLGPYAAFLVMASVLTVQALFFADGGLLALGCNIWNLGIYPAFVAYPLIYKPLVGKEPSRKRVLLASVIAAVAALQMGAFSVVVETLLSGRSELPFGTFVLFMQPIHLAIGIVEGFITAGILLYIRQSRPDILDFKTRAEVSLRKILLVFAVLALIVGGVLSWFASTYPDGLEWSVERVYGKTELPEQGGVLSFKKIQEKTSILPDYGFRSSNEGSDSSWPKVDAGTSVSGIIGSAVVFFLILIIGLGIRLYRARKA